jgi:hypothetical protein
MAKIEAWEQKIRDDMQMFADQANGMFDMIFVTHYETPPEEGEEIPELDVANDPDWPDKLRPSARELFDILLSILRSIIADEDGNAEAWRKYVQISASYLEGIQVELSTVWQGNTMKRQKTVKPETFKKNFQAYVMADWLLDYFTRYKDVVHLGVCRECQKVYLKPKHGQKMRYCRPAHRQAAYRRRKKESDG